MINDVELDTVTRYLCNEGVIIFKFKVWSALWFISLDNVVEVAFELLVSSLASWNNQHMVYSDRNLKMRWNIYCHEKHGLSLTFWWSPCILMIVELPEQSLLCMVLLHFKELCLLYLWMDLIMSNFWFYHKCVVDVAFTFDRWLGMSMLKKHLNHFEFDWMLN